MKIMPKMRKSQATQHTLLLMTGQVLRAGFLSQSNLQGSEIFLLVKLRMVF